MTPVGAQGGGATAGIAPAAVRRDRQPLAGVAAAGAAAAGWGVAAVFVRLAHDGPLVLTEYRLAVAALLLIGVLLVRRRHRGQNRERSQVGLRLADLRLVVLGGVLLAADMACFFSSIERTSIADASVISALQPALVMLVAGPLFKERVRPADIAWTAVAITGVSAVVVGGGLPSRSSLTGDLLAVLSLLAWTAYFLVSKRARHNVGTLDYTFGVTAVATVAVLPLLALSREPMVVTRPDAWLWIALLAVVPGSAHLLINWAHRVVDVSVSSVVGASNPLFAAAAAWLVLGQRLVAFQIAGGVIAIVGIGFVAGRRRLPFPGAALEPGLIEVAPSRERREARPPGLSVMVRWRDRFGVGANDPGKRLR